MEKRPLAILGGGPSMSILARIQAMGQMLKKERAAPTAMRTLALSAGPMAPGISKGGYHLSAHNGRNGRFKGNQRAERRRSRRRRMKPQAR